MLHVLVLCTSNKDTLVESVDTLSKIYDTHYFDYMILEPYKGTDLKTNTLDSVGNFYLIIKFFACMYQLLVSSFDGLS